MPMTPDEFGERMQARPFKDKREEVMTKVALIGERNTKKRTPVGKTGNLRRGITHRVAAAGRQAFVGTTTFYGPFVHEGTRYMEGRPFIEWGIQDSAAEIAKVLKQAGDEYFAELVK